MKQEQGDAMQEIIPLPSSERVSDANLQAQAGFLAAVPLLQRVLDAIPSMVMLLNPQRQLLLANRRLIEFAGAQGVDELRGLRPGEILECVHALEGCGGCGTTPHCSACGSLRAIADAQLGAAGTQVCLMARRRPEGNEPVEFEISATELEVSGQKFTFVCYDPATDRMLRERLEFSILPQAGAVATEIEALTRAAATEGMAPDARRRALGLLEMASSRLASLVHTHSDLTAAETGKLPVTMEPLSARELMSLAVGDFAIGGSLGEPEVQLEGGSEDVEVETDRGLARKALREILLNALQAAPSGQGVRAGFRVSDEHVDFYITNPGEMSRAIQLQVCSRAFSTKARGRGYGAYYAKLVTERYLRGELTFESKAGEGTTFAVRLPRKKAT